MPIFENFQPPRDFNIWILKDSLKSVGGLATLGPKTSVPRGWLFQPRQLSSAISREISDPEGVSNAAWGRGAMAATAANRRSALGTFGLHPRAPRRWRWRRRRRPERCWGYNSHVMIFYHHFLKQLLIWMAVLKIWTCLICDVLWFVSTLTAN